MIPIKGKTHDLGDGFFVTRLLPQAERRSIGPFVFFDYFGPVDFPPGKGIDVRPHPHIGLATVTYLFDGSQMHRDTLGSVQEIKPGDVNWMTAGRGIAHSERTGPEARAAGHRLHGIQSWVGLPAKPMRKPPPGFQHFAAADLPEREDKNVTLRLITGEAFGLKSPVKVFSPIFYADARFAAGGSLHYAAEHEERALFVIDGEIQIDGGPWRRDPSGRRHAGAGAGRGSHAVYSDGPARVMLLGGAPLDGPRHIWWNFVSSSKERIERAKQEWKDGNFGLIPGDDKEFIPLPAEKIAEGAHEKRHCPDPGHRRCWRSAPCSPCKARAWCTGRAKASCWTIANGSRTASSSRLIGVALIADRPADPPRASEEIIFPEQVTEVLAPHAVIILQQFLGAGVARD